MLDGDLLGEIQNVVTLASGRELPELRRLRRAYGGVNWRKRRGEATIRAGAAENLTAEVHWYEAHGIGRVELKLKRYL